MTLTVAFLVAAWFYPQMDLEIYRLNKMWEETDNVGMRAAHPGEVAKLRDHVEFRRKKDDGSYETQTIWPRFRRIRSTFRLIAAVRRSLSIMDAYLGDVNDKAQKRRGKVHGTDRTLLCACAQRVKVRPCGAL